MTALKPEQGLIFNIQRFSLHDGPGIRTVVFFKGCPLRCKWCCNPESWQQRRQLLFDSKKCAQCGKCVATCSPQALNMASGKLRLNRDKCDNCLTCVESCLTGALVVAGTIVTVSEILAEIEADSLFYENSGGGMTASGGEPLLQPLFLVKLLKACKDKGISTALETSGYASQDTVTQVLPDLDLVLFDIKHMNPAEHRRWTGVSNDLILANAEFVASRVRTWLRFPLIPGINDSKENLAETALFAARIGIEKISLLPYHSLGSAKYRRLGKRYTLANLETPSEAHIAEVKAALEQSGKPVTISY